LSQIEGTVIIFVAKTNFSAKTLYEKFGFHVVDEFKTTYNDTHVLTDKMTRI